MAMLEQSKAAAGTKGPSFGPCPGLDVEGRQSPGRRTATRPLQGAAAGALLKVPEE
ncbi:hypothetical protein GCM10020358_18290 [Amorphoplanes nipponensis]